MNQLQLFGHDNGMY